MIRLKTNQTNLKDSKQVYKKFMVPEYLYLCERGQNVDLIYTGDTLDYDFLMSGKVEVLDGIDLKLSSEQNDRDYFVTHVEIASEISEIASMSKGVFVAKLRAMIDAGVGEKGWPEEFKVSEQGYIPTDLRLIFSEFDDVWNRSLSFYLTMLSDEVRKEILSLLDVVGLRRIGSHDVLKSVLQEISEVYKIKGEAWSKNWMFFVDMHTCYRYYSKVDWNDILTDTYNWFNPKPIKWRNEKQYLKAFKNGIKDWFNRYWKLPTDAKFDHFNDFVESLDWGTNGATDMHVPKFTDGSNKVLINKNKNASSMFLDAGKLVNDCLNSRGQVNKVSIKPDESPNKTRVIVSSDTRSYLLMSYLSQWLTKGYQPDISTVYQSNKYSTYFWLEFMSKVKQGRYSMPLDQKGFDHHVTKNMIHVFLDEVIERAKTISVEAHKVSILLKRQILNEDSVWSINIPSNDFDGHLQSYCDILGLRCERKKGVVRLVGSWRGGIASGWRWTIDMDTIINYAEFYAITQLSYELKDSIVWNVFQGDDLAPILTSYDSCIKLLTGYRYCGLEINVRKFFISKSRHEFLRKVVSSDRINGYPARSVHSLLWRANTQAAREDTSPWSVADLWMIQMRRGFDETLTYTHMVNDIAGSFSLGVDNVRDWLGTPASVGGYGGMRMFGWSIRWVRFEPDEESVEGDIPRSAEQPKSLLTLAKKYLGGISKREIAETYKARLSWLGQKKRSRWLEKELSVRDKWSVDHEKFDAVSRCEWNRGIPNILKVTIINRILSGACYASSYLQNSAAEQYEALKSHCSKRVLREWMEGGIRASFPKDALYNNEFVSGFWDDKLSELSKVLGKRKCNRNTVRAASLNIELQIYTSKKLSVYLSSRGFSGDTVIAQ